MIHVSKTDKHFPTYNMKWEETFLYIFIFGSQSNWKSQQTFELIQLISLGKLIQINFNGMECINKQLRDRYTVIYVWYISIFIYKYILSQIQMLNRYKHSSPCCSVCEMLW